MSVMSFSLGASGSETAFGVVGMKFDRAVAEIGRQGRVASGKLVKDITAEKSTFVFTFAPTTGVILKQFQDIYDVGGTLNLEITDALRGYSNYAVLMDPIVFSTDSNRRHGAAYGFYTFRVVLNEV